VVLRLLCEECETKLDSQRGWRAYLLDEDERKRVVLYCPRCAVREFGPLPKKCA